MKNTTFVGIIFLLMLVFCFWIVTSVQADDTGFVSPYNFGETYSDWRSAEDSLAQDDKYGTASDGTVSDENDFYEFAWTIPNHATINGILVETDAYKLGTGTQTFDYKLSWNGGSSWTSTKNTGDLPTSDTDTYIQLGGSTDTWGRTWSSSELDNDSFRVYAHYNGGAFTQGRTDHIRVKIFYTWLQPEEPTEFFTNNKQGVCNTSEFQWIKGSNGDKTLIRYSSVSFPASPTSGTLLYNGTDNDIEVNYDDESMGWDTEYYLTIWAYNTTYHSFSSSYEKVFVTPCEPDTDETLHKTGYDNLTLNYESWVNVTWESWFNDSDTDTLETVLGIDSQYINTSSGDCDFPIYYNYSDDNVTFNITINGCSDLETTNTDVNESGWLFISGLSFENETIILIFILSLFICGLFILDTVKAILCMFSSGFLSLTVLVDTSMFPDLNIFFMFLVFIASGVAMYKAYVGITEGDIVFSNFFRKE